MPSIAIIGMACRYPEAHSPRQLWENTLAQRRSFRRIPQVRLNLDDYSVDGQADDRIYLRMAAVLEDYEFDRIRFQVSRETFASTDLVHWLALDVASQALADAKLLDADDSRRERIGVYIGNSLTGEFSRANLLRLRWPYLRRVLAATLQKSAHNGDLRKLLEEIESLYKAPFPATTEESLAGGLANTIAGRICNYFNLKGGGYTVDGACASSLLAVANACSALESGDVDIAIAGGVDLSLDPFELAGFSKLGALAPKQMRVFDAHSEGFWPGEGCGMVVLMRHEEAVADHHSPYAVVRGWGISSDGSGGITRPELSGQLLALRRAYQRAGYGIDSVSYIEGHGTGTSVGDAVELQALSQARREANAQAAPAAIGSIKANIGHTKAAAGVAGLIKATMAIRARVMPPTTGCDTPHSELTSEKPALRVMRTAELWPDDAPVRSGVSAMGFGGINTHVTLEACDSVRRKSFTAIEQNLIAARQDSELFLFQATDTKQLSSRLQQVLEITGELSFSEMADLATSLAAEIDSSVAHSVRAACIASTPDELEAGIKNLHSWCVAGEDEQLNTAGGIFLSARSTPPRIAFLFPGQGSPVYTHGGIWSRRFSDIRSLYQRASLPAVQSMATETAQPCVVTASLAGLRALQLCGIEGSLAVGHSLGEITALHWAGACDEEELLRVVQQRGRIMAQMAAPFGAMASIRASLEDVKQRLNGDLLSVAAHNSPLQTVVSGRAEAVERFASRIGSSGITATMLPVSHAFHSPLVTEVATGFSRYLEQERFAPLGSRVISTVTGSVLDADVDLHDLLTRQVTVPVQFAEALSLAAGECDLLIEVGPGAVLSGLATESTDKPAIALNVAGESLRGLLLATGAAFALGANIRTAGLFAGRFVRPFDLKHRHSFLQNPCETILHSVPVTPSVPASLALQKEIPSSTPQSTVEVLRNLVAQRTELPLASIKPESRFLDDLHLNSITVSQIILQAATQLNLPPPAFPTESSNASLAHAAETLEQVRPKASARTATKAAQGVEPWIRLLTVELVERPTRAAPAATPGKWQIFSAQDSPLAAPLEQEFRFVPGNGAICCVPDECNEDAAAFLLEFVQTALKQKAQHILFLQQGGSAKALARTLYLEHPGIKVTVVNAPAGHPQAAAWAAGEAKATSAFTEAHYDADGVRREPRLKALWMDERTSGLDLGPDDVLLVTGGGKGIAAECALELARHSRCHLALLGRSDPTRDPDLQQNLLRFKDSGVSFRYFAADVTDTGATADMIREIEAGLGAVTAVLHGAGINHPKRLEEVSPIDLHDTFSPKVTGLRNLLDVLNPGKLRLLLTFGSIIARTGLHGEGHYGLANEWMAATVERWQTEHPQCRCINLDWSVWAGAGMGQRLGVLDSLTRQGITPLPLDQALDTLEAVLGWKQAPVSAIVTGRFGNLPTLRFAETELPLRRFLEHVQVHYPGIELIADAELSTDTDPYVADHVFQGEQLLPAVSGIEAMAQIAMALENSECLPEFHNLRFQHPIVIPKKKSVRIRIAALRRHPGVISMAIRCSTTAFQVDHFTAECRFLAATQLENPPLPVAQDPLALNPARDLYGSILFHEGRFRRVDKYLLLQAHQSLAELTQPSSAPLYARHLPGELTAGDPSSRDAALHSIQACIPHKTILPVGIDRIQATRDWTFGRARIYAVERSRDGDNFVYDVIIQDSQGRTCERWQGLHLRAVAPIALPVSWPLPLLVPYLERKLFDFFPTAELKVTLPPSSSPEGGHDIDNAVRQMAGPHARLGHRPDGKPEITGSANGHSHVSLSHSGPVTLLVLSNHSVGCDLEQVAARVPATWKDLLGEEDFALASLLTENFNLSADLAATQIWTLKESLKKSGAALGQPLRMESARADHWILCSAGPLAAATFHARIEELKATCALGFVVNRK